MNPDDADILALKALTYLAQLPDEIDRFVALSGLTPRDLRSRADDREVLAAVMDFLLADDQRLLGFCEALAIDPKDAQRARHALPGG